MLHGTGMTPVSDTGAGTGYVVFSKNQDQEVISQFNHKFYKSLTYLQYIN